MVKEHLQFLYYLYFLLNFTSDFKKKYLKHYQLIQFFLFLNFIIYSFIKNF